MCPVDGLNVKNNVGGGNGTVLLQRTHTTDEAV